MARQIVKLQFMMNYQQVCSRVSRKQQRRRLTFVRFLQSIIPMEKFFHQLSRDILTGRHTRDSRECVYGTPANGRHNDDECELRVEFFHKKKTVENCTAESRAQEINFTSHWNIPIVRRAAAATSYRLAVMAFNDLPSHIFLAVIFVEIESLFSLLERNSETFGDSVRQSILSNTIQFPSKTIDKVFSLCCVPNSPSSHHKFIFHAARVVSSNQPRKTLKREAVKKSFFYFVFDGAQVGDVDRLYFSRFESLTLWRIRISIKINFPSCAYFHLKSQPYSNWVKTISFW